MQTCCRIRIRNKLVLGLLIHAEGSTFNAVLETTENIITAATAGVSGKLKYGSRPLQDNWVQQLFSACKQNKDLQQHPALVFICWTLLMLGKPETWFSRHQEELQGWQDSSLPLSLTLYFTLPDFQSRGLQTWRDDNRNTQEIADDVVYCKHINTDRPFLMHYNSSCWVQ